MPEKLLVISLRYMGDVLLTTPLIRSLGAAHPGAEIDALVFAGTEPMLEGNPDVRQTITVDPLAPRAAQRALWRRLWRRYDLAVVAETSDRPHIYGWMAARRRVGLLPPELDKRWWKRLSLERGVVLGTDHPRLTGYRMLAQAIGIEWRPAIVAPSATTLAATWREMLGLDVERERYAVLHLTPRFRYKRWHVAGWRALIAWLHRNGVRVIVTGGPGAMEREYVQEVLQTVESPVINACGQLRMGQTADLLRGASVFIGPDTATTHLAAACGAPTVALFGPTDPRLWGPRPSDGADTGYAKVAPLQRIGNVSLIQEPTLPCVPCQEEGCERHRESRSDCLDRMSATRVIEAVQEALLGERAGARH